jgi:hypothetical protein
MNFAKLDGKSISRSEKISTAQPTPLSRDCVPALRFAFSDPIVESHLEFSVIGDKRFLKMNLLAAIGEFLEM